MNLTAQVLEPNQAVLSGLSIRKVFIGMAKVGGGNLPTSMKSSYKK